MVQCRVLEAGGEERGERMSNRYEQPDHKSSFITAMVGIWFVP